MSYMLIRHWGDFWTKLNKNLLGYPKYGLKVAYITGIVTHVLMESFLFHTTAGVQFYPLSRFTLP